MLFVFSVALDSTMLFSVGTVMSSLDEEEVQHPRKVCVRTHPCWPQSHSNLVLSLFFRIIGARLRRAKTTRRSTVSFVMGSIVEDSCWRVVPALKSLIQC